jgi:hypothetical protein
VRKEALRVKDLVVKGECINVYSYKCVPVRDPMRGLTEWKVGQEASYSSRL